MTTFTTAAVDVWAIHLDASGDALRCCWSLLAADEVARAHRFHFERHRHQFVVARAALRVLLGRYLSTSPLNVAFSYGAFGKPTLAQPDLDVEFNVAHSGDIALYALSRGQEVGVDVERIEPLPDIEGVARRFFSAGECFELLSLPEGERLAAFYNCWTRKEAYLKALGSGLAMPLDRFEVSIASDEPPTLRQVVGDPLEAARWQILSVHPAADVVGAVAVRRFGAQMSLCGLHRASEFVVGVR